LIIRIVFLLSGLAQLAAVYPISGGSWKGYRDTGKNPIPISDRNEHTGTLWKLCGEGTA